MKYQTPRLYRGNKIKTLLALMTTAGFITTNMMACSSDSNNESVESTDLTSQGIVTGFGSVFVNGVEWEIDAADLEINDESGLESDLEIGMRVNVTGTVSDDGQTGEATGLVFDADVEGPIESITPIGNDGDRLEIMVLGQRITVDRSSTSFDDADAGFGFDTMMEDDLIEVSGLRDGAGDIVATYIEKEGVLSLNSSEVEFKGSIEEFDDVDTFVINGITVTFNDMTDVSDLPGGVVNGAYVEVEGILNTASTVTATEIEEEHEGLEDDLDDAEMEGFIANFVSISDFTVGGQSVDASSATLIPDNPALFVNGAKVKVEGAIVGGVLVANEVAFRGDAVRISAEIDIQADIDLDANTVTLLGIVVTVDNSTRLKDDNDTGESLETQGLGYLNAGDFLEVRGYPDGLGGVMATRLEREESSSEEVELRGRVDSFDAVAQTITILGVRVQTDVNTQFENAEDALLTEEQFYEALAIGDLVELEGDESAGDKTTLDVAVEAEFEDE